MLYPINNGLTVDLRKAAAIEQVGNGCIVTLIGGKSFESDVKYEILIDAWMKSYSQPIATTSDSKFAG